MALPTQKQLDSALDRLEHAGARKPPPATIREFLKLVRDGKARLPQAVSKFGAQLLKRAPHSLPKDELWLVHEQVVMASLDSGDIDVAVEFINKLDKQFPRSLRVAVLKGMFLEAHGEWDKAEKIYSEVLEGNEAHQMALKRRVAIAKQKGDIPKAISVLKEYLEVFMVDAEAWEEMASIYCKCQMYKQAAFCYEELILIAPSNPYHHLHYADILYAVGGIQNMKTALAYYSLALDLTNASNMHAMYGILAIGNFLKSVKGQDKMTEEEGELVSNVSEKLQFLYSNKQPDLVSHMKAVLP